MAMIRQLGKPTLFLTVSAGEKIWPELLQCLSTLNMNKTISIEEALHLDDAEKSELVTRDPVTCARYSDYKENKLLLLLNRDNSVFDEYLIEDSYERVEFQVRGSPHEHIFFWIKDAPIYDPTNCESVKECIQFIDRFIACKYDKNDVFMTVQRHRHTHTCYKGTKSKMKCRFNFPQPIMNRTMILDPLNNDDKSDKIGKTLSEIRNLMLYFSKKQELVSFEDILIKLKITEDQYIVALRSSLKRPQVFLKRSSLEVNINCYNKTILHLFEANIDVQFVLEVYGIASYIINYVGKVDAGLSKLLRDAESDVNSGNINVKEKFRKITNIFLNNNLMWAQEAAYHVLSLPLSKSSRQTIYINTSPINERALMLKSPTELRKLNSESNEIFMDNVVTKYVNRPPTLEKTCLADFVSSYSKRKIQSNGNDDELIEYRPKEKVAIIRYRRYKLDQDSFNYYRKQILLFLAWRNEAYEVENVDTENVYLDNIEIIEHNRQKYSIIGDDVLDRALENVQNEIQHVQDEEINSFLAEELPGHQQIDILQQDGKEICKDKFYNRFICPKRVSPKELLNIMSKLNNLQRDFVMHVLNSFKRHKLPLKIFLSGSAGVGKSTIIKCIYQMITNYHDNLPGSEKDKLAVLLCAPSGKAAFLINGITLLTAFALPVVQFGGRMPELSADLANNIREKLFHLKLLIIDEISMVGSTLLSRVDTRLRQIRRINKPFGDLSVIVVDDLNQLPPVMDSPIYKIGESITGE
ncbi:uncharacterized protein LOC118196128 [Stegodyphus dumicola]|uniref:uncharacterized protein LOC118196128 n=1 Tax=Stegodyphus dumicola TaxID=202533 RepID=UPI0015B1B913|nr:uncharacterized protein LOC118196128 [Stegodyphus dumicola]